MTATASDPSALTAHLFAQDEHGPRLVGSRCRHCATMCFPLADSCPRCGGVDMERELYRRTGVLWSFTTQNFCPKPPYIGADDPAFEPYAVGYVEFAGQGVVEGRIATADPAGLRIGMGMKVALAQLVHPGHAPLTIHCFHPTETEEGR